MSHETIAILNFVLAELPSENVCILNKLYLDKAINCDFTQGVDANITVNKAGTVTYRWDDNKGGTSTGSLVFDAAGTKTVHHSIPIPGGGDGTYSASLYIDVPNHQFFGSISVDVDCS